MRRFHGALFTLSVGVKIQNNLTNKPHFACVVSKKVALHAVERNRIRRLAKESFRAACTDISGSSALVFYAKKEAKTAPFKAIDADIRKLLSNVQ